MIRSTGWTKMFTCLREDRTAWILLWLGLCYFSPSPLSHICTGLLTTISVHCSLGAKRESIFYVTSCLVICNYVNSDWQCGSMDLLYYFRRMISILLSYRIMTNSANEYGAVKKLLLMKQPMREDVTKHRDLTSPVSYGWHYSVMLFDHTTQAFVLIDSSGAKLILYRNIWENRHLATYTMCVPLPVEVTLWSLCKLRCFFSGGQLQYRIATLEDSHEREKYPHSAENQFNKNLYPFEVVHSIWSPYTTILTVIANKGHYHYSAIILTCHHSFMNMRKKVYHLICDLIDERSNHDHWEGKWAVQRSSCCNNERHGEAYKSRKGGPWNNRPNGSSKSQNKHRTKTEQDDRSSELIQKIKKMSGTLFTLINGSLFVFQVNMTHVLGSLCPINLLEEHPGVSNQDLCVNCVTNKNVAPAGKQP